MLIVGCWVVELLSHVFKLGIGVEIFDSIYNSLWIASRPSRIIKLIKLIIDGFLISPIKIDGRVTGVSPIVAPYTIDIVAAVSKFTAADPIVVVFLVIVTCHTRKREFFAVSLKRLCSSCALYN